MKIKSIYVVMLIFALLLALILSSTTIWRMCSICGVQDFERSLFGKKVELISTREVDEYGTYAQWKKEHNTTCNHQWIIIDESSKQVQKHLDSLK
ncbi:hypothetical protein UMM65_09035 [Aureibaculum sp. 2210JD6-5]|uniref:hypothetical protein n=1 Tax=Aureibaculum sp. 2210JD6-5 TaxID=3103957 RepID=UPI002AAE4E37|nr:hypothetical protein [Aureibaculum sp. 2210JD6-5]MDY7395383.1 hypothetical protein [Aureibaculum sp. 2210JD6-5]